MKRELKKEVREKLDVLDPKFRKQIEDIFENVNVSVSMLYDAATTDKKTNVYNYNFFQTIYKMEFDKAKRRLQQLSLFILDIDFFKKINDVYGHIQADEMLVQLARILKNAVRKSDVVARFGGEEFIILFPETGIEKAKEITSRIREAIKKDKFLREHNLTVSGGLTEYYHGDTPDKMLKRADKALYDAKETGRDKLVAIGLHKKESFYVKDGKEKHKIKEIKRIEDKKMLKELKDIFY